MNNSLEKGAEILLKGGTMLQIACPVCKDPVYKLKEGSMFCVTCDRVVIYENHIDSNKNRVQDKRISVSGINPIQKKIEQLSIQLENETDHSKIIQLAQTIRKLQQLK